MATEPLLTISTFARAVNLSASALRFYDEVGLLRPAEVDARTGYRYYTPELERRAHLIRRMREAGVTVETMRAVLGAEPERAAEILHRIADKAGESARQTATMVAEVVAELRRGEQVIGPVTVEVDGAELSVALRRASRAAATESESSLRGVLLDVDEQQVTVVATNRYWLVTWSIPTTAPPAAPRRLVVGLDAVQPLARWLYGQTAVTMCLSTDSARIIAGEDEHPVDTIEDRFRRTGSSCTPNPLDAVAS